MDIFNLITTMTSHISMLFPAKAVLVVLLCLSRSLSVCHEGDRKAKSTYDTKQFYLVLNFISSGLLDHLNYVDNLISVDL